MKVSRLVLLISARLLAPHSGFAREPAPLPPSVPSPALSSATARVDFAEEVKPIFEYYCYECHGNGKSKGGVRLDVKTNAMMHIVAGEPKRSDVYRSITRSFGASDRMPPVSREQPAPDEIALIREWIEQGADWLPPVSGRQNVTFAEDIRQIFEASCFNCHGEKLQRGGLRLTTLEGLLKGGDNGPVIFPGKSDRGNLVLQVAGLGAHDKPPPPSPPPLLSHENPAKPASGVGSDGMPLPKPLTAGQIGLIRAWIAQGAK